MTNTQTLMDLPITENAQLISIYGDRFCTIIENDRLYLLKSTVISRYNVIAEINIMKDTIIYDRDKANLFVDWSHEHFGKSGNIEDLSEQQIKDYISSYLEEDLLKLIKFDLTEVTGDFLRIIRKFDVNKQIKIFDALEKMKVYDKEQRVFTVPYIQAMTVKMLEWNEDNLFSFIKLDAVKQNYDICQRTIDNGYIIIAKNGSCGTFKKIAKDVDNKICLVFNQQPKKEYSNSKTDIMIETKVQEDLSKLTSYTAANQFVKLEERFSKSIDELISISANKDCFVDLKEVYYPQIDKSIEQIAKLVRRYQYLQKQNLATSEQEEIVVKLHKEYKTCYEELEKAQKSLKALWAKIEK